MDHTHDYNFQKDHSRVCRKPQTILIFELSLLLLSKDIIWCSMETNDFRCPLFVSKYEINVQTHDSTLRNHIRTVQAAFSVIITFQRPNLVFYGNKHLTKVDKDCSDSEIPMLYTMGFHWILWEFHIISTFDEVYLGAQMEFGGMLWCKPA